MKYESYEQFLSTIPEENIKLYDESSLQLLFKFEQSDSELDKVRKQLSEAIEVIKFYGERSNWYSRYGESDGIIKNDSVDNYSQRAGGRRAREFLKSLEEK